MRHRREGYSTKFLEVSWRILSFFVSQFWRRPLHLQFTLSTGRVGAGELAVVESMTACIPSG